MWLNSNKGTFQQNINNTIMKNIKSYVFVTEPIIEPSYNYNKFVFDT